MGAVECEVWLLVSSDGTFAVATDKDELQAEAGECCRLVKVTVSVPRPMPESHTFTIAQ